MNAKHLERILASRPELNIYTARQMPEAGDNDVIIVDGASSAVVFRFAKSVARQRRMAEEVQYLAMIRARSAMPVPQAAMLAEDLMSYPLIAGERLTPWLIATQDEATKQRLADQLGTFLRAMHGIPDTTGVSANTPAQQRAKVERRWLLAREKLYPRIQAFQREWVERLFEDALRDPGFFDFAPALIHNDFKVDHILFDAATQRISGIIDFGWACYDDPAIDICNLLQWYGESFVSRMHGVYPEMRPLMPRARFGAFWCEVDWLIDGLEPGGQHWFFANLATNRDVRFPIFE